MTFSLALHAGATHYFELCWPVFQLNADPSLPTWLCISLSAGLLLWSILVLQARLAPVHRLPTLALKLAGSRSATYNLATALLSARSLHLAIELLSARGRAPRKYGLCCESSSRSSVLLMARVLQLHNGVLCNLDLFLKLGYVEEFPGWRHFIGNISRAELKMQLRLVFFVTEITRFS